MSELLEDSLSLTQLRKLLRGEQGVQGWEGRTPMHVQESKPTGQDVKKGDLWYQPSTEKLRLNTGSSWKEIAKQGIMGFEGKEGKPGKGEKGDPGPAGKDGKSADTSEMKLIAEVRAKEQVKEHEQRFDHTKIDPFLVGSKKISEAGMEDGQVITYDKKGDRLVYSTIKQVAAKVSRLAGRGLSLPSQSGNEDRILTTDGNRASWGVKITVSASEPTSPRLYDLWLEI